MDVNMVLIDADMVNAPEGQTSGQKDIEMMDAP